MGTEGGDEWRLQGGSKVQDAAYIFQELGEKYNWSVSALDTD